MAWKIPAPVVTPGSSGPILPSEAIGEVAPIPVQNVYTDTGVAAAALSPQIPADVADVEIFTIIEENVP